MQALLDVVALEVLNESGDSKLSNSVKIWTPESKKSFDWENQSCPVDTEVTTMISCIYIPFQKIFLESEIFLFSCFCKTKNLNALCL